MAANRHIAIVAPPWYATPPHGYGGIELVVHLLVQGLRRRDVKVTVYGCEGSAPGTVELAPRGWDVDLGSTFIRPAREATYVTRVVDHLKTLEGVDVIHDHAEWLSTSALSMLDLAPVVHTVHQPVTEERRLAYEALGERTHLVAISNDQRSRGAGLHWTGTVHNAVDLASLRMGHRDTKEGYLLCLARITPEKGQHLAIEAARRTGRRIVLAGKVAERPEDHRYFEEQVAPLIDNDRVVYRCNVAGDEKVELLARASALIQAVSWPEPFGLAMVEAMASGTPCIALAMGSAPELIVHGETGYLAADTDGLVEAIAGIDLIDPVRCASHARAHFSPDRMAENYLEVYERVIRRTAPVPAVTVGTSLLELAGALAAKQPPLPGRHRPLRPLLPAADGTSLPSTLPDTLAG